MIWRTFKALFTRLTDINSYISGSVFFMFGLIMAVAGVVGLTFGSGLSYWLRPKYRGVDPLICGGGLVPSSILILVSFIVAYDNIWAAYILVFFGQVFLNMNWAVIVDMTLVSLITNIGLII